MSYNLDSFTGLELKNLAGFDPATREWNHDGGDFICGSATCAASTTIPDRTYAVADASGSAGRVGDMTPQPEWVQVRIHSPKGTSLPLTFEWEGYNDGCDVAGTSCGPLVTPTFGLEFGVQGSIGSAWSYRRRTQSDSAQTWTPELDEDMTGWFIRTSDGYGGDPENEATHSLFTMAEFTAFTFGPLSALAHRFAVVPSSSGSRRLNIVVRVFAAPSTEPPPSTGTPPTISGRRSGIRRRGRIVGRHL